MERHVAEYPTNKMNKKKREIVDKEGLESDEQEVEDLRDVDNIE
jgi:DNA polymerase III delta prime subunit